MKLGRWTLPSRRRDFIPRVVVVSGPGTDVYAAMDKVYELANRWLSARGFVPEVERDTQMWAHWVVPPLGQPGQPFIKLYPSRTEDHGARFRFDGNDGFTTDDLMQLTDYLIDATGWLRRE